MLEEKIVELEMLVAKLENENISIEEGIALFEQGIDATKNCLAVLSENKGKITSLKKLMSDLFEENFTEND